MTPPPPKTRHSSDDKCSCDICDIARMGGYEYTQFKNDHSNPVGTPANKPLSPHPKLFQFVANVCQLLDQEGSTFVAKSPFSLKLLIW